MALAGFLVVAVSVLFLTELYLRLAPPEDLHDYMGEASPLRGPFVPDPEGFQVAYPSYQALRDHNPSSLQDEDWLQGPEVTGAWLFFGTSFVHMRGALHDTFRELVPGQPCLKLDRREPLLVRLAQIRTLLAHGARPGRIILVLMPVDMGILLNHDLSTVDVTRRGALVLEVHPPPAPLDWVVRNSRLALCAWVRAGRHQPYPDLERHDLYNQVPDHLTRDLRHLLRQLSEVTGPRGVPVTVLLIPTHRQAVGRARCSFQDAVQPLGREAGMTVVDLRDLFQGAQEVAELYVHDGHLSRRGYRFAVLELMRQLGQEEQVRWPTDEAKEP